MAARHWTMLDVIKTSTCSSKCLLGSCRKDKKLEKRKKFQQYRYDLRCFKAWSSNLPYYLKKNNTLCLNKFLCEAWNFFVTCFPTFLIASCSGVILSSSSTAWGGNTTSSQYRRGAHVKECAHLYAFCHLHCSEEIIFRLCKIQII